jgi:hypothetical protein
LGEADLSDHPRLPGPAGGREALLWQWDGGVLKFSLDDGKARPVVKGGVRADAAAAVALPPSGRLLTQSGNVLRLHDEAGRVLGSMPCGSLRPEPPLAVSPDGTMLAGLAGNNGIHLIEAATGRVMAVFDGHRGAVRALEFSPDGRSLASAGADTTVLVWHVKRVSITAAIETWLAVEGGLMTLKARRAEASRALVARLTREAEAERLLAPWLGKLDDEDFEARQEATESLERHGARVAVALKRFLAGKPPLEPMRRAERLLERLGEAGVKKAGEPVHPARAVRLLRLLGTEDCRVLLRELAALPEGVPLGVEARRE